MSTSQYQKESFSDRHEKFMIIHLINLNISEVANHHLQNHTNTVTKNRAENEHEYCHGNTLDSVLWRHNE